MAPSASTKGLVTIVVLLAIFQADHEAMAQSGCTSVLISLSPCLNYVTGSASTPSTSCCSKLATVVQSQPQCLCMLLNGGSTSLGVKINETLAMALPGACKVETPPVSRCNAVGDGPATAPIVSTEDSPTGSPSESPVSGGSKAEVSSPIETGRAAISMKKKDLLHFTAFLLLVAMGISH